MSANLSKKMRDTLGHIAYHAARGVNPFVTMLHPQGPNDLGLDYPTDHLAARTLFALWKRGLVRFRVTVQLTVSGKEVVEHDPRSRPGDRSLIQLVEDE